MKAIVSQTVLSKELKKMSFLIKKNPVIPLLSSVLFVFKKGNLQLTATDLETTYISSVDCECHNPFSIPIEYSDISDICSNAVAPIQIQLTEKYILVESGKSKWKLPIVGQFEHYPITPDGDYDIEINVNGDFFFNLSNANSCRLKDDLKVNMNMAAIQVKLKELCVVGTDGAYFFKKSLKIKSKKELTVMVCDMFVQSCKTFQDCKISIGQKFIKAECGNEIVISRLSENKFVNYEMIIPKDIIYNITVEKDSLKNSVRAVSIAADLMSKQCVLNFSKGMVKITSQDIDFDKNGETELELEHSVDIDAICCNGIQLMHLLNILEGNEIELSVTGANKTIFMRPLNDDTTLCLLQPLMINI